MPIIERGRKGYQLGNTANEEESSHVAYWPKATVGFVGAMRSKFNRAAECKLSEVAGSSNRK
jgi:hypothetical protein